MNEGFHLSRHNYFCLFSSMIGAWRDAWRGVSGAAGAGAGAGAGARCGGAGAAADGDIPFSFVQLHACDVRNEGQQFADFSNYGDIRMAQVCARVRIYI